MFPVTCVFTAVHLQMGQLKVLLAAAGMSTHKRTLLARLCLSCWSKTRNPPHILVGEVDEEKAVLVLVVEHVIFILRG